LDEIIEDLVSEMIARGILALNRSTISRFNYLILKIIVHLL